MNSESIQLQNNDIYLLEPTVIILIQHDIMRGQLLLQNTTKHN